MPLHDEPTCTISIRMRSSRKCIRFEAVEGYPSGLEPEVLEEGQEQSLAWLIERLDDHERAEIDSIARALERIDRGEHGICEDCREPIPLARLEAVPTTELCIRCAELREAQAKKA